MNRLMTPEERQAARASVNLGLQMKREPGDLVILIAALDHIDLLESELATVRSQYFHPCEVEPGKLMSLEAEVSRLRGTIERLRMENTFFMDCPKHSDRIAALESELANVISQGRGNYASVYQSGKKESAQSYQMGIDALGRRIANLLEDLAKADELIARGGDYMKSDWSDWKEQRVR